MKKTPNILNHKINQLLIEIFQDDISFNSKVT
jgi:hypothetical protein